LRESRLTGAPRLVQEWLLADALGSLHPVASEVSTATEPSGEPKKPKNCLSDRERPQGVSETAWETHLRAKELKPSLEKYGISKAAQLLNPAKPEAARRDIHRVRKALREQEK
jgi:ribosomal protein L29